MEKLFFLDSSNQPLYIKLYQAIKEEIIEGKLTSETKIPSVRQLSKSMNLSRTTVENAYLQLVSEGYLYAEPQKGYFVSSIGTYKKPLLNERQEPDCDEEVYSEPEQRQYDFVSEFVQSSAFNLSGWKKSIYQVFSEMPEELYSRAKPFGEDELKQEIAEYFSLTRGVKAEPAQIVIGQGSAALLRTLSLMFEKQRYHRLLVDNPGFNDVKHVFTQTGFQVTGVELEQYVLNVQKVISYEKSVLFTSPSYQFPFGEIMPVNKRMEILKWAEETDSYIVEDDYNNEFRYIGKPVGALQGMDLNERVIYVGSFSTLMIPSIRISFMILPKRLMDTYKGMFFNQVQGVSKLEQLALAKFIQTGRLSKHIRKNKALNKSKNRALRQYLDRHLSEMANIYLPVAGTTAVLEMRTPVDVKEFEMLSRRLNVSISRYSDFTVQNSIDDKEDKFVINYRGIDKDELEEGVKRMKELLILLSNDF